MPVKHHNPAYLSTGELSVDHNKLSTAKDEATYALGILEASQRKLQNSSLLIAPLTAKEATVSSEIEGTQSTVSDVFLYEAGGTPKFSDTIQVANYRQAIVYAMQELNKGRKISKNLIESLHEILLRGVRYKGTPGKIRTDRVWIARNESDPIEKAIYVPPEAVNVQAYVDDMLKYLTDDKGAALLKAGIFHYQFEAVHPFEDGNGRIGRLMIPLILYQEGKLSSPILYLSGYLEDHKAEYMKSLRQVDKTSRYEPWLNFYMSGVAEQLQETQKLIADIELLYESIKKMFPVLKSPYLDRFINHLFESPITTVSRVEAALGCTYLTARNLIGSFEEKKLLTTLDSKDGRAKLYAFGPLIDLL